MVIFRVFLIKMDTLNVSYFDFGKVEKYYSRGEILKAVSVKQFSITKRSGVYDQCNSNYPCRVHSLC